MTSCFRVTLGHLSQMQNHGPCPRVSGKLNDWEWGPGLGISSNRPQMTLMQPAVLDSVSAGIGSPFYVETVHRKAKSIACLNPESLPPGNILSATCKAPQAVRKGGMDKDITEGILDF